MAPRGAGLASIGQPRLRRRLVLSGAALIWERLWPALWPATAVVGLFVVVSLFGLWLAIPGWLHILALIGFAAAFGVASWHARGAFALPDLAACIRRLERTNAVPHRPLTTVLDRPAGGVRDAAARALWWVHQRRMAEAVSRLRVVPPSSGLARRDPYAVRAVIVLAAVIGLTVAGEQAPARLASAMEPDFGAAAAAPFGELAAWLTPPEYTGLAPIFLTARTEVTDRDQPVPVAVGSELVARVHGGASLPVLRTGEGAEATEESAFTAVDDANFELQTDIRSGGGIEIRQGDVTLGAWTLDLIPDRAPEIELPVAPKRTQRSVLRIEYQADDDYGLTRVAATIHRLDDDGAPPIILQLPLASTNPASAHETSYHDLTPHPWAGMPVRLEIRAEDHAGQIGKAAPVEMVLPARDFSHPVARAIVEQRRVLALAPDQQRAVRTALGRISERPGDYGEDLTAYLALRIVVARLGYPQDEAGHAAVLELLWEVALRIEDGALSLAERDLRKAQEALRQALDANASNEELEELMAELEKALEQYLDLLDQQAQQSMAQDSPSPLDPSDTIRSREDLEQMLEQTRDLAMTGAREAAQDMLSRLQEMLENLQTAQSRLDDATGDREPLMRELENLMSDQQELMEDTFEQLRARGDSQRFSPGDGEQSANRQEMLRRALGEIMRGIGESGEDIPEELGRAERMMRDAREELERSRPDRAIDPQAQALDQLREGAQKLRSQWAGRQGTQPGEKDQADPLGENRDPLGRLPPGMQGDPTGFVQIPKDADIRRSREILDELYRRAGERHRPAPERDYIDRLLRWY